MRENESIISVSNFTKNFKNFVAVKNISFNIKKGTIHGFIGPNGSGKTTTIKTIIGAYTNKDKNIYVKNYLAGSVKANKLIGYIPERAAFPSHLNTYQYLVQMAQISGLSQVKSKEIVQDKLMKLNMWDQKHRNPNKFSSGMQKKIMLIQALLTDPEVLIMDEPSANLDPIARKELFNIIFELKNEGKTIFISSHILSELERVIDSVTFIYYGKLLYSGSIVDLLKEKTNIFIKTNKNEELLNILKVRNFNAKLLPSKEIVIYDIKMEEEKQIIELILLNNISIEFFKKSDLLMIYNDFVEKENNNANL